MAEVVCHNKDGRKKGQKEGSKHLLDTCDVLTYLAMHMNCYFLIYFIITMQSKNSTHIQNGKTEALVNELTFVTPEPMCLCSMMLPCQVAVYH